MTTTSSSAANSSTDVVLVEIDTGVAWVTLNRPEKRNAMNPALNRRMQAVLDQIEADPEVGVMVLTGAGPAFSAGMDLQEYFRDVEGKPRVETVRARREAAAWWRRIELLEKPSIAMVNGWCFGGAFTPLYACDIAIAADEAQFGISEVNWGVIPAGNVALAASRLMNRRDALFHVMTGLPFGGRKAAEMGLVNESVPLQELRARVRELANILLKKNPAVLNACRQAFKNVENMSWDTSLDYLIAKNEQLWHIDPAEGRQQGEKQFLDDKTFKPGLDAYDKKGDVRR